MYKNLYERYRREAIRNHRNDEKNQQNDVKTPETGKKHGKDRGYIK